MTRLEHLSRAVALMLFAAGGLLIAAGDRRRGDRAIAVAIALVAAAPLCAAGASALINLEVFDGQALELTTADLLLAVVLLAGVVALVRRRAQNTRPQATSHKKRVEPGP